MSDLPTPELPHRSYRLDSIDALRGLAALMVVLYHVWGHYGVYPFPSLGVVPETLHAGWFSVVVSPMRWGYLGVGLFLVLSGFCIHLPFARKNDKEGEYKFSTKEFYLRRLWRLYPAYGASVLSAFLLLVLLAPFSSAAGHEVPSIGNLIAHLTLTHGYFDSYFYGIIHVYWSLALEFQLYLAYPFFLLLFRKVGLTKSIVMLTVVSLVWRYLSLTYWGFNLISVAEGGPYSAMGSVLARMPEWLFGVWIAEWFVAGKSRDASRIKLSILGVIGFAAGIGTTLDRQLWVLTDPVFGLGFAMLIAAAVVPNSKGFQAATRSESRVYRSIIWFGTISYTVYLFHMPLSWFGNEFIQRLQGDNIQFILRILVFLVSIPILAYIYKFVEAPFLKPPRPNERYHSLYERLRRSLGMKKDKEVSIQFSSSSS